MRFAFAAAFAFACVLLFLAAEPAGGVRALFNGTDLDGWHGWAIHAKGGSRLISRNSPRTSAPRRSTSGTPTRRSTGVKMRMANW